MMSSLSGKTALVTGASRGIGKASALMLAQAGAQVLVHYNGSEKEADAVVKEIRAAGGRAEKLGVDLRAPDGPHKLAKQARAIIGDRLDILVANAGIAKAASIEDTTVEDFDNLFAVNVRAPFFLVQQLLPVMCKGSSVILLSSTMGSRGMAGASLYSASKHAVEGITKSAALEAAAYGIRVNAVAPGPTETEMLDRFAGDAANKPNIAAAVPLKRFGTPEEIAEAIVFLASDKASFITGQIIAVNGGKTAG